MPERTHRLCSHCGQTGVSGSIHTCTPLRVTPLAVCLNAHGDVFPSGQGDPEDGPFVDGVAVSFADCENPPDAWLEAAAAAFVATCESSGGPVVTDRALWKSVRAAVIAVLAASRAEAEGK